MNPILSEIRKTELKFLLPCFHDIKEKVFCTKLFMKNGSYMTILNDGNYGLILKNCRFQWQKKCKKKLQKSFSVYVVEVLRNHSLWTASIWKDNNFEFNNFELSKSINEFIYEQLEQKRPFTRQKTRHVILQHNNAWLYVTKRTK